MTYYLSNSFSLQMLGGQSAHIGCQVISPSVFKEEMEAVDVYSIVGHKDTARVLGVPYNRESITLKTGDVLCVAQLNGGRLPEGVTELPDGYSFTYYIITTSL